MHQFCHSEICDCVLIFSFFFWKITKTANIFINNEKYDFDIQNDMLAKKNN